MEPAAKRSRVSLSSEKKAEIQYNLYKCGSMGRAKLELPPCPGYNLYYEVCIFYLIASLFGLLINNVNIIPLG